MTHVQILFTGTLGHPIKRLMCYRPQTELEREK